MTLDEYEQMFMRERYRKQENQKRMIAFIIGVVVGQIIGVTAFALVSINRGE